MFWLSSANKCKQSGRLRLAFLGLAPACLVVFTPEAEAMNSESMDWGHSLDSLVEWMELQAGEEERHRNVGKGGKGNSSSNEGTSDDGKGTSSNDGKGTSTNDGKGTSNDDGKGTSKDGKEGNSNDGKGGARLESLKSLIDDSNFDDNLESLKRKAGWLEIQAQDAQDSARVLREASIQAVKHAKFLDNQAERATKRANELVGVACEAQEKSENLTAQYRTAKRKFDVLSRLKRGEQSRASA